MGRSAVVWHTPLAYMRIKKSAHIHHFAISFNYFPFFRYLPLAYGSCAPCWISQTWKYIFFPLLQMNPPWNKIVATILIHTHTFCVFVRAFSCTIVHCIRVFPSRLLSLSLSFSRSVFLLFSPIKWKEFQCWRPRAFALKGRFCSHPFWIHNIHDYKIITESRQRKHSNTKDLKASAFIIPNEKPSSEPWKLNKGWILLEFQGTSAPP